MNLFIADLSADSFCDHPDSSVIYHSQLFQQVFPCQFCEIIRHKAVHMLFQRTDGLHKSPFEVTADAHHLTGSFHLCSECPLCTDKLVKRKSGNLNYTIIQHRLKAGISLSCNCIGYLIQGVSKCYLGSNLSNGISRRLRSQS